MNQIPANKNHLQFYNGCVTKLDRNRLNRHRSGVVWFTGLPGSGKSTLAHRLEKQLLDHGVRAYVLDGDNVRHGLNADLGFSREDRKENIRRIVEVSRLLVDAGIIVLSAFISPYREDRDYARQAFANDNFLEVYLKCPPEECERRDPKGQYTKARQGIIPEYTGITAPYEAPENAELVVDTQALNLTDALELILDRLNQAGLGWQPDIEA